MASTSTSASKSEALQNKTNSSFNAPNKRSNNELKSKPIPESDLSGYAREKTEKSVERDTKKNFNDKRNNISGKQTYHNSYTESKGGKSSRITGGTSSIGSKSDESTMGSLKARSIQKSVQEDNSSRESDNGPLDADVEDFLQAESKANNPIYSREEAKEAQGGFTTLAKIDNLLR